MSSSCVPLENRVDMEVECFVDIREGSIRTSMYTFIMNMLVYNTYIDGSMLLGLRVQ